MTLCFQKIYTLHGQSASRSFCHHRISKILPSGIFCEEEGRAAAEEGLGILAAGFNIERVQAGTLYTGTYWYILVHTSTHWYILVHTSTYWYILGIPCTTLLAKLVLLIQTPRFKFCPFKHLGSTDSGGGGEDYFTTFVNPSL